MSNADKGFNSNAVIIINHWRDQNNKLRVFAENIKHIAGIEKVILEGNAPMGFAHGGEDFKYKGKTEMDLPVSFEEGSEDFIPFYQMKLVAGRNIMRSDSLNELVINEALSKAMGFSNTRDAIGKLLYQGEREYPIVGVVADFHEGSFHEVIKPVVIGKMPGREWSAAVKLTGKEKEAGDIKKFFSSMENEWKKVYPETPFDYSFLNESITWLYGQEKKQHGW